jgi:hypothetical protein
VKQTETQPKQIEFRFFSVQTENIFCLFRGHPSSPSYEEEQLGTMITSKPGGRVLISYL